MFDGMNMTDMAGQIVSLVTLTWRSPLAEGMVVITNFITIFRLGRMKRRYPEAFAKLKEPGS